MDREPISDPFLHFLASHEKELERIYKKSIARYGSLAVSSLLTGRITPGDIVGKDRKTVIKSKYRALLSREVLHTFKKYGIQCAEDHVEVFGKKFFFVNLEEIITGFVPIVVHDQYDARHFLKEDSIVFDAGANIGIFSVFAATLCPRGKVYSFEPASVTFGALQKNAEQYPNMTACHNGVGDISTTKKLLVKRSALGANHIEDTIMGHNPAEYPDSENIEMVTIDDFVKKHDVPRVDFIKMDTEGYELNILKGAEETIRKFSPVIATSAYHHPSHKVDIPKYILSIDPDYHYELRTEGEEDFIFWK